MSWNFNSWEGETIVKFENQKLIFHLISFRHNPHKGIAGSACKWIQRTLGWTRRNETSRKGCCGAGDIGNSKVFVEADSFFCFPQLVPYKRSSPRWLKLSADEISDHIFKLARKGLPPSQIGVILRDSHGVAQVKSVTGNKILRILKTNGEVHSILCKERESGRLRVSREAKDGKRESVKKIIWVTDGKRMKLDENRGWIWSCRGI